MSAFKKILKTLLSQSGDVSTVRLMALLSLATGIVIGFYGVYKGSDLSGVAQICAVFIGAAFGGKVAQKFAESKDE